MKTLPAGMQTDLDGGATTHCLCWKLTREDGTVMGFTDHDTDLVFDTVTFKAATGINASAMKTSTGMNVNDMEGIGALDSSAITEADISKKLYDNAFIQVYRVDWSDVTKRVEVFTGFLGTVVRGDQMFKAEVRSLSQALNQPMGEVYQKTCNVDLFSPECGKLVSDDANYEIAGDVSGVFSRRLFATTTAGILGRDQHWFTGGKLTWTSGNNNGLEVEVKVHIRQQDGSEAWIDLWEAMPADIQVGDDFDIVVGCDKIITTCKAKFNNVINFRGFPRMPGQDIVTQFAAKADRNDGTSWYS